jgi:hypothetical protein
LIAASPLTSRDGAVVGFATFGSGAWHLGVELLLAHALAQRGARPELLLCDMPDLPVCDERLVVSRDVDRCVGCIGDKRALLEASRLAWRGVSTLVPSELCDRAVATVAALGDNQIAGHVECGFPIGEWLHVSASHYLRADARGGSGESVAAKRRFLATAIVIVHAVRRWLDLLRPDVVIAESGAHVMWRIALELSKARGIPVVCREMGKGGWDRHIYALNADAMAPDLSAAWREASELPLSQREEQEVDEWLADLPARTFVRRGAQQLPAVPARRAGHRVIVAFTNVTWDLATAGRDVGFSGVVDWLRECIRVTAALPRTQLIIRVHPAEAGVMTRESIAGQLTTDLNGAGHVTIVGPDDPIDASQLIASADLVLAYNSTAGLEAVMRGKPVMIAGRPHFAGKGFTIDITSREHFAAALRAWAGQPIAPITAETRARARRYFHLFYLRYHIPMGWTTSPIEPPYELLVRSLDELGPGRNPALDVVCDGILGGRQILLPRLAQQAAPCRA